MRRIKKNLKLKIIIKIPNNIKKKKNQCVVEIFWFGFITTLFTSQGVFDVLW